MALHTRSNSFPPRSHPLTSEVDEHLSRLASSESASTSSSSLYQKLNDLQDLQDCVQKLLLLPLNQQALGHEQQRKYVDEMLNGSIRLFDVCTAVKDALLQTKECTQELQSVLRRRQGAEITQEVKKYLASRKAVKKAVLKPLKNLKNKENKCNCFLKKSLSGLARVKSGCDVPLTLLKIRKKIFPNDPLFPHGRPPCGWREERWIKLKFAPQTICRREGCLPADWVTKSALDNSKDLNTTVT